MEEIILVESLGVKNWQQMAQAFTFWLFST